MLSPVKVCEESEATTNIQLYEIKQMSFAIKLYLKNDTALTNTFFIPFSRIFTIFKQFVIVFSSLDRILVALDVEYLRCYYVVLW